MKTKKITVLLNRQGVDEAAENIQSWLTAAGVERRNVLRIRLTMEELLEKICSRGNENIQAELTISKFVGSCRLRVRYGGERFDPTRRKESELEEFSESILAQTGFLPTWRWRGGKNELSLHAPAAGLRPEYVMLGSILAAVAVGVAGAAIPEPIKTGVTDYVLKFFSSGFLNLLNTFIGVMVFLAIVNGICGIGSVSAFGRIGKLMVSRYVVSSFLVSAIVVIACRLCFRLGTESGGGSGSVQALAVLEMIFGILPTNPVKPFLEGNNLQIVFMGLLVGAAILMVEGKTDRVAAVMGKAQAVVMKCISVVCMLLPVYIFCSLLIQIWSNGAGIFARLWKPILLSVVIALLVMAAYLAAACVKFKVKLSVLLPKLLPDFIIGLSTCSAAVALSTTLENDEKRLGMDPAYCRTAAPIGGMLLAGVASMLLVLCSAYVAECYGVKANLAWWLTLWIAGTLLTMAIPPVAGGGISCLSILLLQMQIPQEGLPIGVTLMVFLDYVCTSSRIFVLNIEMLFQADKLGMLDREILRKSC